MGQLSRSQVDDPVGVTDDIDIFQVVRMGNLGDDPVSVHER